MFRAATRVLGAFFYELDASDESNGEGRNGGESAQLLSAQRRVAYEQAAENIIQQLSVARTANLE